MNKGYFRTCWKLNHKLTIGLVLIGLLYGFNIFLSNETVFNLYLTLIAAILPIYHQRYLLLRKASYFFGSLPMKKEEIWLTHYVLGLIQILLVILISVLFRTLIIGIDFSMQYRFTMDSLTTVLLYMLSLSILSTVIYAMMNVVILYCHNILDTVLSFIAYSYAPHLIYNTVAYLSASASTVAKNILGNISSSVLSPSAFMNLVALPQYLIDNRVLMISILALYALFAILFTIWGFRKVQIRQIESAETCTDSTMIFPFLAPFFLVIMTLAIGELYLQTADWLEILRVNFFKFAMLLFCYFVPWFVQQRKFFITKRMIQSFAVILTITVSVRMLYVNVAAEKIDQVLVDSLQTVNLNIRVETNGYDNDDRRPCSIYWDNVEEVEIIQFVQSALRNELVIPKNTDTNNQEMLIVEISSPVLNYQTYYFTPEQSLLFKNYALNHGMEDSCFK